MPDYHVADGPFSVPSSIIVDDKEYKVGEAVELDDDQAEALRRQGFTIGEGDPADAPGAQQESAEQPAEQPPNPGEFPPPES